MSFLHYCHQGANRAARRAEPLRFQRSGARFSKRTAKRYPASTRQQNRHFHQHSTKPEKSGFPYVNSAFTIQRMFSARKKMFALVSELQERVQRLETGNANLLARIEREAALRASQAALHVTPTVAAESGSIGSAEAESDVTRAPVKRGRAGGLARAYQASRHGERWSDGRFMSHEDWEQIEREIADAEYMRYAAGGFARAATAQRATDGTFLKT